MTFLYDLWSKQSAHSTPRDQLFVFDCDKTLITGDLGEASLRRALNQRWIISHEAWWRHLDLGEVATSNERAAWRRAYERDLNRDTHEVDHADTLGDELWRAYERLCEVDVYSAYIYAARFAYQRTPAEVHSLTRAALQGDQTTELRPVMERFVNQLQDLGGQVWVVSSSHIDVVRVIAEYYNIPMHHVIGIDFVRDSHNSGSSERLVRPVPIDTGKVDALFAHHAAQPALMVGDSFYDLPLMATAQQRFLIDHHTSADLTVAARALDAEIIDHELLERYTVH